jgi:putative transposase
MKISNPEIGLSKLCCLFGLTRQAYYKNFRSLQHEEIEYELLIKEVIKIRKLHPKVGTRKLYLMLEVFIWEHHIKIGRDLFFDLLSKHGLLIRRRKRSVSTTQSHHWLKKYPNLIRQFIPYKPNRLYVSDITYWKIDSGFVYISLVTDAYSHKIVGYNLAKSLEAIETLKALEMALSNLEKGTKLIHHSDRGVQYCSYNYVNLLQDYQIEISMTENGDPLENAIAERINGILKEEYLHNYSVENFNQAQELLDSVIQLYNEDRLHMSIGYLTPANVHNNEIEKVEKKWKNYYKKKDSVNLF